MAASTVTGKEKKQMQNIQMQNIQPNDKNKMEKDREIK